MCLRCGTLCDLDDLDDLDDLGGLEPSGEGGVGVEGAEAMEGDPTNLATLFRMLMIESGYEAMLRRDTSASSRWRNLGELANLAS